MKDGYKALIGILLLSLASVSCKTGSNELQETQEINDTTSLEDNNKNMTASENTTHENSIIAGQAKPQLISKQFSFTEGPAADKQGNVFFTDQPNNKIWKYDTAGNLSVFLDSAGRANGLYFDKAGNLIACADEKNQLWSISPEGKVTVLVENYQGHRLNGPNDVWVAPNGGMYFTDPYYQRDYWERQKPDIDGEKVYFLPEGKMEPVLVADDMVQPNGIVGTPDGKYLYIADIGDSKTYKYEIAADGSLTNRQLFVAQGSDGMTIDNRGNVYLTGKGVTVYNPAGEKIEHIPIPADWTGNVCFGGENHNVLFITASEAIYTLPMQTKGVQ